MKPNTLVALATLAASGLATWGSASAQSAFDAPASQSVPHLTLPPIPTSAIQTQANAQVAPGEERARQVAVRLAIILPSSRTARDLVGRSSGQIGVSYAPRLNTPNFAARIDLDYGRFSRRGNRIEPVTLLATGLVPLVKRDGLARGPYVGAGVGAAYTRVRLAGASTNSKTRFAGKAFIGYNFTNILFGEIGYNFLGKVNGVNPSNTFIQIGARF